MSDDIDTNAVRAALGASAASLIDDLECFDEIPSTNSYLLEQSAPARGRFRVAIAGHQTAGRGRMDKRWHSPGSSGLCLSVAATFEHMPRDLPSLTLAMGVGIVQALERLGAEGVGLKWPNDLVANDGKLGGILTEARSSSGGEVSVVVGIGLNHDLRGVSDAADIAPSLGRVADLHSCMPVLPARAVVAGAVLEGIVDAATTFASDGFSTFADTWPRYDWLAGRKISVDDADGRHSGRYAGIDEDGALLMQTLAGQRRVVSGTVSLDDEVFATAAMTAPVHR